MQQQKRVNLTKKTNTQYKFIHTATRIHCRTRESKTTTPYKRYNGKLAISAAILLQNIANKYVVRVLEFRQNFCFLLKIASAIERLKTAIIIYKSRRFRYNYFPKDIIYAIF